MKRAITGIVAASLTLGTMAPAAFAATTSTPNYFGSKIAVGTYSSNVQALKVQDAGNTTALFPFYYIQAGLESIGYTVKWDGVAKRLDITTPAGVTLNTTNLDPGVGAAGIYVNGTLVQRAPFQVAKDMGGNKQDTSFMAAYYLNLALGRIGFTNSYDGTGAGWVLTPAVQSPAVVGVKGLNATQVEVDFNTAVDSTDAAFTNKYSINGQSPVDASPSADGKSVVLTFGSADYVQVTNGALVVNPIKTAADDTVLTSRYVTLFTFADTTAPTITGVTSATRTSIATSATVSFSEPIKSLGAVKVDGVVVGATGFTAGDTSAEFDTLSLDVTKSHTIQFIGLKDQADNTVADATYTFTPVKDTTAPTATLSAQGDHTILITFNKQMDANSVVTALGAAAQVVYNETLGTVAHAAAAPVAGSNNTQFTLTLTTDPYTSLTSRTFSLVLPSTMKDYLGNAFVGTTQKISLSQDTVKPVITGVSYKTDSNGNVTDILVKTNEGVSGSAITPSDTNLVIVTSSGVLVPTGVGEAGAFLGGIKALTPAAGATTLDFQVQTPAAITGQYAFTFQAGFLSDMAFTANSNAATNVNVNFGSAQAATSFTYNGVDDSTHNTLVVDYGTSVKGGAVAGSATDLGNYTLNGAALPTGTTIYLSSDQKKATITLPSNSIATTDSAAVFTISNVQDLTGVTVKPVTTTVHVYDNTQPTLNFAALNADNSITFGFDESLSVAPVTGDLVVTVNGTPVTVTDSVYAGSGSDTGKYVVSLADLIKYDVTTNQTYLDVNNNGFDSSDVVLATGDSHTTVKLSTSVAVSSVTVGTKATGNTTASDGTNYAKDGVTVTAK